MVTGYSSAIWSIAFGRSTPDGKRESDFLIASPTTVRGMLDTLNACGSVDLSIRRSSDGVLTICLINEKSAGANASERN